MNRDWVREWRENPYMGFFNACGDILQKHGLLSENVNEVSKLDAVLHFLSTADSLDPQDLVKASQEELHAKTDIAAAAATCIPQKGEILADNARLRVLVLKQRQAMRQLLDDCFEENMMWRKNYVNQVKARCAEWDDYLKEDR